MTDKELADKIVALGVGEGPNNYVAYSLNEALRNWQPPNYFVRDWRVAGALMEKVDSTYPEKLIDDSWQVQASMDATPTEWITNESLPRAINEACVEAIGD